MKYNSIGEQLIAKAQELDPNYKPDKFNDMSEALSIILNNSGGGSGDGNILDIGQYLIFNDGSNDEGIISQEGYEKLNSSSWKIVIAHFRNEMFDVDFPFILEKYQEINGTLYLIFYGIELDFKSFKQHKKGILIINMDTKSFVANYENISDYSTRVFEPIINSVSISNDDTNKQLTFNFNVSNFEIITYLTTLIENNKPFTETLYLKTPAYDEYHTQFMFNTPLSLINASTNIGSIYHCFSIIKNATSDMKGIIAYDEDTQGPKHIILNVILSNEEDYTGYKQLASALFTTDTKIKITIKTDE